jgi:hypothetical protein
MEMKQWMNMGNFAHLFHGFWGSEVVDDPKKLDIE